MAVGDDGDGRGEQVHPAEIGAMRANRRGTDPNRKVRFLPYGIAIGGLDNADEPG